MRLSGEATIAWKERFHFIQNGPRKGLPTSGPHTVMTAVRAFYLDVDNWAVTEPDRWSQFAAPNPIYPSDGHNYAKMKRRQRAPLMPRLVAAVEDRQRWTAARS